MTDEELFLDEYKDLCLRHSMYLEFTCQGPALYHSDDYVVIDESVRDLKREVIKPPTPQFVFECRHCGNIRKGPSAMSCTKCSWLPMMTLKESTSANAEAATTGQAGSQDDSDAEDNEYNADVNDITDAERYYHNPDHDKWS